MSQNIPWLAQALMCVVCKVVLKLETSAEAARRSMMCNHCRNNAWAALKQYAMGNAGIGHLKTVKVAKGYMFSEEVVNLFAVNMGRLSDFVAFTKWWTSNTVGQELDPKYPSLQAFVDRVTGAYNAKAIERHAKEVADEAKRPEAVEIETETVPAETGAVEAQAAPVQVNARTAAREALIKAIKKGKLNLFASKEAIETFAAELEAAGEITHEQIAEMADAFISKVLGSLTPEQKVTATAPKGKTKKGRKAAKAEERDGAKKKDAPDQPEAATEQHTADTVIQHPDPTKTEGQKPEHDVVIDGKTGGQ